MKLLKIAVFVFAIFVFGFFSVILLTEKSSHPLLQVQIQERNKEVLSLAQKTDLIYFNDSWFIVIQNLKNEQQLTIRDPRDNSTNTYSYSIIVGFSGLKVCSNPNPNNPYNKTILKYFVGVE